MEKTVEGLIEEARQLSLPEQLRLIERLARSVQRELEKDQALREEFAAWERLSDEALDNFEKVL